jgi:hypothetical protein
MDTVSIDSRTLYSRLGSPLSPLWCRSECAGDKERHSGNLSS